MTIKELQTDAAALMKEKKFTQTVECRLLFLISELGELADEIIKLRVYKTNDKTEAEVKGAVGLEIYDLFWNLAELANQLGIDLEEVFAKKARMNKDREWK